MGNKTEKYRICTMNRIAYILIFWTLIAISCVKEDFTHESSDEDIKMVDVSLNLFVAKEGRGTQDTKSIDDQPDAYSTVIRNINVLQFSGTDDNATIVGEVQYLSDTAEREEDKLQIDPQTNKISMIKLADSEGQKHTIVILTNTFEKLIQVGTLGEMKALFRTIYKDAEVFGYEGDAKDFPDGENTYYQRMNAIAVTEVVQGTVLRANLRRSMARIKLHIENDLNHSDNLRIKSVQLLNVSAQDYYLTDYRYIADPVTRTEDRLYDHDFQDDYDPSYPRRIDYALVEWDGEVSESAGERKEVGDYTFYVPANQRGIYADNNLPQEKNRCPNVDGATHARICATYGPDGAETDIVYTFYLGANLVNDFNICPNTSYTYNLRFSGKGNSKVDNRIDDLATVHFGVDANCYILPIPKEKEKSYTFNAIHRPNVFWGDRYGLNAKYPNYTVDREKEWKARLLWSDLEMTKEEVEAFLVKSSGDGKGSYMDMNQRIKVTVPSDLEPCNVVVGMYLDDPDNIIWSWHLWITKYNPDNIERHAPIEGKFVYPVEGGEVHRYNGVAWTEEDGLYKNGYAMDRVLGSHDPKLNNWTKGGGLVYQWGRKDPFSASEHNICTYDSNGVPTTMSVKVWPVIIPESSAELQATNGIIPFSVNCPTHILSSIVTWGAFHNQKIQWNDPKASDRTDCEELGANKDKSFFDPCPPGWRVPYAFTDSYDKESQNCYSGFYSSKIDSANEKLNLTWGYGPDGPVEGYTYYPKGFLAEKDNPSPQTIYFPYVHGRKSDGTTYRGCGFLWTSQLHWSLDQAYALRTIGYQAASVYREYINTSCSVRCVRKNY